MNTPDPFAHAKILFMEAGARSALLVTNKAGRRRAKAMRFADAHGALSWCLENRAAFVCSPPAPRVGQN